MPVPHVTTRWCWCLVQKLVELACYALNLHPACDPDFLQSGSVFCAAVSIFLSLIIPWKIHDFDPKIYGSRNRTLE